MTSTNLPCPWCESVQGEVNGQCTACRGVFPPHPRVGAPPTPPPSPRTLPTPFAARVLKRNDRMLGGLIGIGFGGAFLLLGGPAPLAMGEILTAVIFIAMGALSLAAGVAFFLSGRARLQARRAAYELGVAAPARIVAITQDTSVVEDDPSTQEILHPWQIDYEYSHHGAVHRGSVRTWSSPWHPHRRPGDPLWVMIHPQNPAVHEFWPPFNSV